MCGRFTSLLTLEMLEAVFGVTGAPLMPQRFNIAPSQQVLAVREAGEEGRSLSPVRWGLVPHWAKDMSMGSRMINARAETIHEKPAFRQAIRTRRCIIPASGFYEWRATASGKTPHYITMRDGSPMAFAGIWDVWKSPEGERVETCAILTTSPNSLMATIHDRMPVILHQGEFTLWLDRTIDDPQTLQRLYQPYPAELMQEWQVSTAVNSPRTADPSCVAPL